MMPYRFGHRPDPAGLNPLFGTWLEHCRWCITSRERHLISGGGRVLVHNGKVNRLATVLTGFTKECRVVGFYLDTLGRFSVALVAVLVGTRALIPVTPREMTRRRVIVLEPQKTRRSVELFHYCPRRFLPSAFETDSSRQPSMSNWIRRAIPIPTPRMTNPRASVGDQVRSSTKTMPDSTTRVIAIHSE